MLLPPGINRMAVAATAAGLLISKLVTANPITIITSPVPLDSADITRTSVGELTYLGGLRLRSPDPSFGGLSAVQYDSASHRLIAVTDQGAWFTATLTFNSGGTLIGLAETGMTSMQGIDNLPLLPPWSDAESIAVAGNRLYVAFERENRLYRYGSPLAPWEVTPEWLELPDEIAGGPRNGGMEAITNLEEGRILIFAEEIWRENGLAAWILDPSGATANITLFAEDGFLPTGATTLANGDILLLERRFSILGGFTARVRRIPIASIKPEAVLHGEVVAVLAPPLTTDNFEAIAAVPLDDSREIILLLSDDNFSALQRTLILAFQLEDKSS